MTTLNQIPFTIIGWFEPEKAAADTVAVGQIADTPVVVSTHHYGNTTRIVTEDNLKPVGHRKHVLAYAARSSSTSKRNPDGTSTQTATIVAVVEINEPAGGGRWGCHRVAEQKTEEFPETEFAARQAQLIEWLYEQMPAVEALLMADCSPAAVAEADRAKRFAARRQWEGVEMTRTDYERLCGKFAVRCYTDNEIQMMLCAMKYGEFFDYQFDDFVANELAQARYRQLPKQAPAIFPGLELVTNSLPDGFREFHQEYGDDGVRLCTNRG